MINQVIYNCIICPECQSSKLVVNTSGGRPENLIVCEGCKRWYPILDGIPRLLPDELRDEVADSEILEHQRGLNNVHPGGQIIYANASNSHPASARKAERTKRQPNRLWERLEVCNEEDAHLGFFYQMRSTFGRMPNWYKTYIFPVAYKTRNSVSGRTKSGFLCDNICSQEPRYYLGNQPKNYEIFSQFAKNGGEVIVDIGCGQGINRKLFLDNGNLYIGCDIISNSLPTIQCDAHKLPLVEGCADMVICDGVLEHVHTPNKVVDHIYRILKPGGLLYVYVPFLYRNHGAPQDFYRYTKSGLHYLLRNFSKVEIYPMGGFFSVLCHILWAPTRLLDKLLPYSGALVRAILTPIFLLLNKLDRFDKIKIICRGYYAFAHK